MVVGSCKFYIASVGELRALLRSRVNWQGRGNDGAILIHSARDADQNSKARES
jgi:hypothetical protein